MLVNTQAIYGYKLAATNGDIGHIRDFYFDDQTWVVRYLIADTGNWLHGRLVLISPHAFGAFDRDEKTLEVKLTRHRIAESPSIETHRPVSRQYEIDYFRYYGWPAYWEGSGLWGLGSYPVVLPPSKDELDARQHHHRDDQHLRSTKDVMGYAIQATDGAIGTVSGFMVDDKSWTIRELVVAAGHWYAGKEIMISPAKIARISYEESKVFVNLTMADLARTKAHHVVKSGGAHQGAASFPTE